MSLILILVLPEVPWVNMIDLACIFTICQVSEPCLSYGTVVRPIKTGIPVPSCNPEQPSIDLWRTNVHIWKTAPSTCDKVLIFEADAQLSPSFWTKLNTLPPRDITWLDGRNSVSFHKPSGCCTNAMLYSKSILPKLIYEFTNKSGYGFNYQPRPIVQDQRCLYDWFLGNLVIVRKIKAASFKLVPHR